MTVAQTRTLPPAMAAIALMGAMVALAGGVWDDAWHTDRGRDSFLIAPHIALYAGVSLIGGALTLWLAREIRAGGLRRAVTVPGLRLGLLSVSATLASAPIDNAWHEAFGRDAVIWSPPHMLGIVGTLSLGVVLLDQLRDRTWPSAMAGGLLLTGAAFPVIEYETDVPQFAVLWYLPVLSAGLAVAFALIRRCAGSASWPLTRAAGVQLLLFGLLALFLAGQGFPAPAFPLLLAPTWTCVRGAGPSRPGCPCRWAPARGWSPIGASPTGPTGARPSCSGMRAVRRCTC